MTTDGILLTIGRRSRAEALYWAGVLIWAGLVFGADSLRLLPQIGRADAWAWVFIGAGLYGTMMNLYSSTLPDSITTTWDWLWSGFWLVIGLSGLIAVDVFWPLVLVFVGLSVLARAFRAS
ncbi:MAG: hypothetical protein ACYTBS_17375 [Planctomycetota bacterium]|jgi:hypothetical protein